MVRNETTNEENKVLAGARSTFQQDSRKREKER